MGLEQREARTDTHIHQFRILDLQCDSKPSIIILHSRFYIFCELLSNRKGPTLIFLSLSLSHCLSLSLSLSPSLHVCLPLSLFFHSIILVFLSPSFSPSFCLCVVMSLCRLPLTVIFFCGCVYDHLSLTFFPLTLPLEDEANNSAFQL